MKNININYKFNIYPLPFAAGLWKGGTSWGTAYQQLQAMYQPLLQITDSLWDSMILSGSEAYLASLMFYNSVKHAAKSKIQKAETIYNDLVPRFPGRPKKDDSAQNSAC